MARWRPAVANACDLVQALSALPAVRTVTTQTKGIVTSMILRDRGRLVRISFGAGSQGAVEAPNEWGSDTASSTCGRLYEPLRLVEASALGNVLQRASTLPALQAVRDLAEQLDHLDRTGVVGLTVKGLGAEHLFRDRVRQTAEWQKLSALAAPIRGEWREALIAAGYELEELVRGYLARAGGSPGAVVHPVADVTAFAKLDAEGRPPEGLLLEACHHTNVQYGILASGTRLRLFEARPESGSAAARYLELDTDALGDDDRLLLGLLTRSYLDEGGFGRLMADARMFGVELRRRLDTAIRHLVLPPLGLELGRWAQGQRRDVTDDKERRQPEAAALTFVFRSLFLLYKAARRGLRRRFASHGRGSECGPKTSSSGGRSARAAPRRLGRLA